MPAVRPPTVLRAAATDEDAELEKRLEKLAKSKTRKPKAEEPAPAAAPAAPTKVSYDYTGETVYYEAPPHRGDLAVNVVLGTTLVWLPLTLAAVGRAAFVKYRFTDRRFSVATTAPWKNEQVDVAYQEVKDVITVGRGVGAWGDMVVTLRDNSKVELRSLDRYIELKEYILKRRDELAPPMPAGTASGGTRKGGEVTAAELMGEPTGPRGFGKL